MVGEIKVNITFWTEQEEQELRQTLDDVIFPHHYVGEEQKRLGAPESDV